jgi:hypothetical protein
MVGWPNSARPTTRCGDGPVEGGIGGIGHFKTTKCTRDVHRVLHRVYTVHTGYKNGHTGWTQTNTHLLIQPVTGQADFLETWDGIHTTRAYWRLQRPPPDSTTTSGGINRNSHLPILGYNSSTVVQREAQSGHMQRSLMLPGLSSWIFTRLGLIPARLPHGDRGWGTCMQ